MTTSKIKELRKMKLRSNLAVLLIVLLAASNSGVAEPGDGIQLGNGWSLSPFVAGTVTYDSNVLLRHDDYERNEELNEPERDDDLFYDLVGGLSLIKETDDITMNLRGLAKLRSYEIYTTLDDETFQQNFDAVLGDADGIRIKLSQQYSHVSDYEFTREESGLKEQDMVTLRLIETRTRRTDRYIQDYGVSVMDDFSKLQLQGGLGYGKVAFGDDTPIYFPKRDLRDWDEYQGSVNVGYRMTDKSSVFIAPSIGQHHSDNGLDTSTFVKFRAGFRSEPTIKLTYSIGCGLQYYRGGDNTAELDDINFGTTSSSDDLELQFFHYDLKAAWALTRRTDFQIFGRNEMIPTSAFDNNTKRVDQGSIGLIQRLGQKWSTSLGLSYRQDTYTLPINGVDAHEELAGILGKIQYDARKSWLQVTAQARYEEFTSNIQEDYQQLRATLSADISY